MIAWAASTSSTRRWTPSTSASEAESVRGRLQSRAGSSRPRFRRRAAGRSSLRWQRETAFAT